LADAWGYYCPFGAGWNVSENLFALVGKSSSDVQSDWQLTANIDVRHRVNLSEGRTCYNHST
jgi:hypothetical protein